MPYILYSRILDWEAGEWPDSAPKIRRFLNLKAAKKAYGRRAGDLKSTAKDQVETVEDGAADGELVAEGGFSIQNLLFRTTNSLKDLDEVALQTLLVQSGCFNRDYAVGRLVRADIEAIFTSLLDDEELEPALRQSGVPGQAKV